MSIRFLWPCGQFFQLNYKALQKYFFAYFAKGINWFFTLCIMLTVVLAGDRLDSTNPISLFKSSRYKVQTFQLYSTQYVTKNSMFLICCWQHMIKTGVRWHWLGKLYASVIRVFVQQCSFLISTFLQFSSICLGEGNKKHNTFLQKQNEFGRFVTIFGNSVQKRGQKVKLSGAEAFRICASSSFFRDSV